MKTLIILGNGFDLDLGWKTSYNDFFQAKQNSFFQFNNPLYIKQMIDNYRKRWSSLSTKKN